MKQIIKGKKYDTETATLIAEVSGGGSGWRDFRYYEETLYKKRTGEYFLYGEGGPMTRYAISVEGNGWASGCKITPLTYDGAREWAEKNLESDEYEAEFGEVVEDDSKTVVTISITVDSLETARRAASRAGISLSSYIESLIKRD